MVECSMQQHEEGDWVCGFDEGDDFCTGHHCDNCLISLCSSECDEYCARTRSPADKENNQCMLCAYPLEDGEEFDNELNTWVKNGETIVWDGWSFSYPSDADYGEEKAIGGAIHQQTRHFGRKLRKGAESFDADAGDNCPYCYCEHKNLSVDSQPPYFDGEVAWVEIQCDDCNMKATAPTYEFEFDKQGILEEVGLPIAVNMMNPNYGTVRCSRCHERFEKSAEGLEFTDWAKQETKHHGKTSLKDWADHEMKKHGGKMSFQDWAKHEDKSHIRRYGAEEGIKDVIDNILGVGNVKIIEVPTPEPEYDEEGRQIRMCRGCMGRKGFRINPSRGRKNARRVKEDIEKGIYDEGDWAEFTYWCHGTAIRNPREGEGERTTPHEWAKWETTPQYDAKQDEWWAAEDLKRDSCCCGATKTDPCACMIQGVMECSATCPCSLWKELREGNWGLNEIGKSKLTPEESERLQIYGAETSGAKADREDSWEKGVIRLAISDGCFSDEYAEWVLRQIDGPYATMNHPRFEGISYWDKVISQAETSGQWEIGEQLEEAQMNAEEFDRGIQDKDGKIYSGEKDRIRKYFKNWEPKSYPYEKRIVSETKSKWCENCGELDEDDEDNWNYYQFFLKQKNSSRPTMRYLTGGYCNDCGSDLCQNCSDGQTSGQFNPLFEPNCDECGYSFCKSCKDEDEDRCNTCQEEYEENVCDCCGYLHHAESFEAQAPRGHKMMTAALGKKIPPMDSQEGMGDEAIVYAHYFNPYGMGEWWILEWDGKDEMFGYADLGFPELGYISLSELENVCIGGMELPIERDLHWREKTLGEVKQAVSKYRAESFSATKGIDTFTEPFDELSLDSGNIKKVIVGIGIGFAGILAYNKWK